MAIRIIKSWETSNGDRINIELADGRKGNGWSYDDAVAAAVAKPITKQYYINDGCYYGRITAKSPIDALTIYGKCNPKPAGCWVNSAY